MNTNVFCDCTGSWISSTVHYLELDILENPFCINPPAGVNRVPFVLTENENQDDILVLITLFQVMQQALECSSHSLCLLADFKVLDMTHDSLDKLGSHLERQVVSLLVVVRNVQYVVYIKTVKSLRLFFGVVDHVADDALVTDSHGVERTTVNKNYCVVMYFFHAQNIAKAVPHVNTEPPRYCTVETVMRPCRTREAGTHRSSVHQST